MSDFESLASVVARRIRALEWKEPDTWSPSCAKCDDSGWETTKDAQDRLWARRCVCQGSGSTPLTNCPYEFAGALLDTFRRTVANADAVTAAEAWMPRGGDLFLWGDVGTGKTRLACAVVQGLHRSSRFEAVDALLRALVHEPEGELWKELLLVPVLILDDVGVTDTDWARRTLIALYSERLRTQKRTVWTSNLSVKQLVTSWGDERLGSRIAGAANILHLTGPDMRRQQRT